MNYCEFYNENKISLVGSDSICYVDGRKTINHQIDDGMYIIQHKKSVMHPYPTYMRLFKGSIREPVYITDYIKVSE